MKADYLAVKASRGAELNRRICAHEAGHAFLARARGNIVEYVTAEPNEHFSGHCMRQGVPSKAMAFVDDRDSAASIKARTSDVVETCATLGAPPIGVSCIESSEAIVRMMVLMTELVAGRVCELAMYQDYEPISAEHDFAQVRALASVMSSSAIGAEAMITWAMAEAEGLIRANLHVVVALADALDAAGTLAGKQVDRVIASAVDAEKLRLEKIRRQEMKGRHERAAMFKELTANV